jgi:hypothetical protein
MISHQLHNISIANALVSWGLIYLLVRPALNRAGQETHLTVLISLHLFRYLGLIALIPSLFDVRALGFSDAYHTQIAYGDWISGLLAIAAILSIRSKSRWAIPIIWFFNIFGIVDFLNAGLQLAPKITDPSIIGDLGWVVFTVYLPMLVVSHFAIFYVLLTQESSQKVTHQS